jgi:hypothetical protein
VLLELTNDPALIRGDSVVKAVISAIVLLAFGLSACDSSPSAPSSVSPPSPNGTFLSFLSEPGDYVGQGRSRRFDAFADVYTAVALCGNNRLEVSLHGANGEFSGVTMSAPRGTDIRPGNYENAVNWPPSGSVAGLTVLIEGRVCGRSNGRFTVTDAVFGTDGSVERFRAIFEQRCDGSSAGMSGEISLERVPINRLMTLCF